jgi:opacity protein-like surface antigen
MTSNLNQRVKVVFAALSLASAAVGTPAAAADLGGQRYAAPMQTFDDTPTYKYYLGVRGGLAFPQDTGFNAYGFDVKNSYDTGYTVSGIIGTELAKSSMGRLRGDIEVGYTTSDVDDHKVSGFGRFKGHGALDQTFAMASLYYDFNTGSVFRPFIGAGGGIAEVKLSKQGLTGGDTLLSGSDTAYAYHLTAGTNIALSSTLDLELAYRFMGTTGAEIRSADGTKNSIDTHDHQVLIGLRQMF